MGCGCKNNQQQTQTQTQQTQTQAQQTTHERLLIHTNQCIRHLEIPSHR